MAEQKKTTQKTAAKAAESAVNTAEDTTRKAASVAQESGERARRAAAETVDLAAERSARAMDITRAETERATHQIFAGYGDLAGIGRDNLDAMVRSGTIMARGLETLSHEIMAFAQSSLQANLTAARTVMEAGSVREAMEVQAAHTRESLESAVSQAAKLTGLSVDIASEAAEPIQSRFRATTEHMFRATS